MPSQTNEQALEALIERALTGSSREERTAPQAVGEMQPIYGPGHGYEAGHPQDFDPVFAIDREKFWRFLESTQAKELDKLRNRPNWERLVLERLDRTLKRNGILQVLKEGIQIDNAYLTLYYSLPYNSLNPEIGRLFRQNIFSVTRQVHHSVADPSHSLDMVLFVNGLAIATIELKNPWTNQTVHHARKQYQRRSTQETLLHFARCVVHFAVDTEEVYMTTRLAGENTYFLPFNKGHNYGKGNPHNPHGHRTAYLWQEVLTPTSLANILEHFTILVGKKKDALAQKTLYFPRYHQLDVVRRLLAHAKEQGVGHTYLIQHSAGSGKSHSITWTAYQLIELYPQSSPGNPDPIGSGPLFDSVVVVTDRRNLDKQLRENIDQFSQVKNIIAPAYTSADLKRHLESGKKIITTTIQKFPHVLDGIDDLSDKRFAVIIDEAHSSQSGVASDKMSTALSAAKATESATDDANEEEIEDSQDVILKAMEDRKLGANVSYFAFTATPKNATLEKFGQQGPDGKFNPFHLYSMKQAIEEGFILDVLANYTTYRSYYQIAKSIQDNPLFDSAKAQKKLRAFVEGHEETIGVKAEIVVEHFLTQVVQPKKLKGQAKAMVVTRNITTAIRYFQAIRAELERLGTPFKAMIAFSGKKVINGIEYTEESLNNFPSKDIEERFDSDEYRMLVVANKFLTGFDQPKLSTMYVDKRLQGLLAVQALSRLNRSAASLGKRTEDIFVLDFYNSTSDIKAAFDDFYTATTLSQATDVNVLHDIKAALDALGVYEGHEVERFNQLYFTNADAEELAPIISLCAERFNQPYTNGGLGLESDEKIDFKIKAKQFVKIYAQVAGILPFNHLPWEKLYWFLKFLIPKLEIHDPNQDTLDALLESVDLSTYGLERTQLGTPISLDETPSEIDPQNPNPRGVHGDTMPKDPLDQIIQEFNERWFSDWGDTSEEKRVKLLNIAQHSISHPDFQAHVANNQDEQNRRIALEKIISQSVSQERRRELELYRLYASDPAFKSAFDNNIMRIIAQKLAA